MTAPLPLAASIAIRCCGFAATEANAREWLRLARHEGAPQDVCDAVWAEWVELHARSVRVLYTSDGMESA